MPIPWPWTRHAAKVEARTMPWGGDAGPGWGSGGPSPWATTATTNPESAMRMVAVWGAVSFLANNISAMAPGLGLYKLDKSGEIAIRQPTPQLFANPSIHGTLVDWLHRAVVSSALQGDAIGLTTQRIPNTPFPSAMEWLNPINVQTLDRAIEGPGSYVNPRWYWWGRPMDPRDLLHIPMNPMPWRVRGLAPITAFAQSVGIGLAAMHFNREWYENGGVPPGTFRNTTQKVLPEDAEEIADRYVRRLRTRRPLIYGMDWEFNPISVAPHEARFLETIEASASQIAVIFGVPPEKVGGAMPTDTLRYTTVEQNMIDCLSYTFRPWLVRFEYAFSTCFPRGYFVQFQTDEFIRVDSKTRAEIDALSLGTVQTGWKDRDEVRVSYNLPPQPNWAPPAPPAPGGAPTNGSRPDTNGSRPAVPGGSAAAAEPTGGANTAGTSVAAAEPISRTLRERWTTNGRPVEVS